MEFRICVFGALSEQDNGLNSMYNKTYASVIKMIVHCTQHRQITQTSFERYPKLALDKLGPR